MDRSKARATNEREARNCRIASQLEKRSSNRVLCSFRPFCLGDRFSLDRVIIFKTIALEYVYRAILAIKAD